MFGSLQRLARGRVLPFLLIPALLAGSLSPQVSQATPAAASVLSVRAVSPSPSAAEVASATTIVVAFDRPVAPLSGVGETATPSPLLSDPPLPGQGRWVTSSVYAWSAKNLRGATTYALRVPAGLKAVDGTMLPAPYRWQFSTVRPQVLNVSPADGYAYATTRPAISLSFNQQMDHASTQAAFHFRDAAGHGIAGTFSWQGATLAFKPAQALARTASYTASLGEGARSAEGSLPLLRSAAWTITVAPYLRVVGSTPGPGAAAADLSNGVVISFSAPVDETSALASLKIVPEVPYRYLSFGDDDRSLQISGQWAPSTPYTVTVAASLRARAGDRLGSSYRLHFVSAPLPPQLYFVTGNIATYDWYRPITLSLQAVNPGPITFTVYRLSQDQFLQALPGLYNLKNNLPAVGENILEFTRQANAPLDKSVPLQTQVELPGHKTLPAGFYLVAARGLGDAADYQLVLVTRTGITLKISQRQALIWATDLKSGKPVAGINFHLATTSGNQPASGPNFAAATAHTNSHGTAMIAVKGVGATDSLSNYGVIAVGARSGDALVASLGWSTGISPSDFGVSYAATQPKIRTNLTTDRPIYRPGQTVHLRGVARADDDGRYSLVTGLVRLVLTDGKGQVTARKTVTLDRFGAFHADLVLAANASLGSYSLGATIAGQTGNASFQVAEYKKPTYSVSISTPSPTYSLGQTIPATVAVNYYFGGGVAKAKVHWSVLGYDYIFYDDLFADYSFGAYDPGILSYARPCMDCGGGTTLYQGDAVTDAKGIVHLRLPAKLAKGKLAQSYTVEANVTDIDNQPVAGRTSVTVYSSALQIGLRPEQQIIAPKVAQLIHVLTLGNDGVKPVSNVPVHIEVYSRLYHSVITTGAGGSTSQQYVPKDTRVQTLAVTSDAHGQAAFRFTAPKGGEYHIVASARDRYGNPAQSSLEIYAGGEKPIDWGAQQQGHIRLVTDKRTYHSGDVAHILVTTPYTGMTALISIERGSILKYEVRQLNATTTTLDIPVEASFLPDTYVSVVAERGAGATGAPPDWRLGYARLHVDTKERTLQISMTPAKPRVGPGQNLPITIHATDSHGKPVQTQLGLSLVDEANLALTGDSGNGSDLLGTFYGLRELGVLTANTLNVSPEQQITKRLVPVTHAPSQSGGASGDAAAPRAAAPGAAIGESFSRNSKSAQAAAPSVRQNFQDTAYWNAALVTDVHGNATLHVPLPDNVTTWKILGQGISTNTLAGTATSSVMATKDLLLRPIAPRFFSLGDRAAIGATVNNTTSTPMNVTVRLLLADGKPGQTPVAIGGKTIRLGANGEQNVTWPVTIAALGTATMLVETADTQHPATNDAVQVALPVQENSTPEEVASSGQAGTKTVEQVQIPAGIEPNEGSLTVTLEPTLASGLRAGADFLARYAYESSIDLASQVLGETELGRLPARASVLTAAERKGLAAQVGGLLSKLYLDQRGDGGFGWWIDDSTSSPYITVFVVEALNTVREHGYAVDSTVLANAIRYLVSHAQSPAATNAGVDYDANLQAEIFYAVTQYGSGAEVAGLAPGLFDVRYLLSHASAAHLMVALASRNNAADHARVQTLLADLTSAAKTSGTSVHWDEPSYDWAALDGDIATTATVLDALTTVQPNSALVAGSVRWLMAARKVNAWESTAATAISLRGLVDYVFTSGELNANYHYSVRLNGTLWGAGTVDASNLSQVRTLAQPLGAQAAAGSSQQIAISRDVRPDNGSLNYVIRLQYFRPVDQIRPASQGVSVTRTYLTPGGKSAGVGSTIRVQLRVTAPQDLFYVTLEDPLPAGAEAVDSSLQTTSQLAQVNNSSKIPTGTADLTWYVTHTDLRDNRTVLFLSYLPAGSYQYTYLIHCDTQGTYHALPAHIQQDYFPEVFGRSNGSYFQVR